MNELKIEKTFTANDIAEKFNCNATTVRAWGRKPVPGVVYDPENVNTEFVISKLKELFTIEELEKRFECKLDEVKMIKSAVSSSVKTSSVSINDLEENHNYILYSHVNKFEYKLVKIVDQVNDDEILFIFEKTKEFRNGQDKYRVLSYEELNNSERWRIREAE